MFKSAEYSEEDLTDAHMLLAVCRYHGWGSLAQDKTDVIQTLSTAAKQGIEYAAHCLSLLPQEDIEAVMEDSSNNKKQQLIE